MDRTPNSFTTSLCIIVVALSFGGSLAAVDAQDDKSIQNIDANNFRQTVILSDDLWVLEFYSPRCGTCQEFTPIYEQLARKHPNVRFGSVNIDDAAGMRLATESGALEEGVPSVRAYAKQNNAKGVLVWAGDDAPTLASLTAAFNKVIPHSKNAARLRKTL